jgi:hypothetical protein
MAARLEWVDDEHNIKYIEVQLPFENHLEDESLNVIRDIKKDFKFYEFYLSFGREHAVELACQLYGQHCFWRDILQRFRVFMFTL